MSQKTIRRKNEWFAKKDWLTRYVWVLTRTQCLQYATRYRMNTTDPDFAKRSAEFHSDAYFVRNAPAYFRRNLEHKRRAQDRARLASYLSGHAQDVELPKRTKDVNWLWF
ncbi:MAG: hypothetical protein ACYC3W_09545 [Candidatus Nanopelagicales bacterium]